MQLVKARIRRFLVWRAKYISNRQFLYIVSILVGLLSGIAAVTIKNTVHLVEVLLTEGISDVDDWLYFLYPLLGIFITVLVVKFVLRQRVGHGIPAALYAISKGKGNLPRKDTFSSIITAAITVGFGGSVGLEGPTVATTSALGSNLGQVLRMNYKTKTLLIACAAAGALASIFNAPVAAIVFAIEVIMIDLTAASLIPLLLASVSAALTSRFFLGNDVLFHFDLSDDFLGSDVPFFILLGLICGLVSIYFSQVYFGISNSLEKIKNQYLRVLIGGSLLGLIVFVFPPLYGEGYGVINALVENDGARVISQIRLVEIDTTFWMVTFALAILMLLKVVATTITLKSGGIGGIFAPTLFMGSTLGFVFSRVFNGLGIAQLSVTNFTLVSMAGLMAGVLHAPLTAMFLIAEITGGYELFLPLMITTAISFITVKYAVPHSVYNLQLAKRGELITHHKDQAVLTLMELKNEIEVNFKVVKPYDCLGDLVKVVSKSSRNLFPVIDEEGRFLGVVTLDDIRDIMFNQAKYKEVVVHELMQAAPEFIYTTDSMDTVMQKFERSGAWNLPVLEGEKYVGFVSKSKLFSAYRQLLCDFYEVEK